MVAGVELPIDRSATAQQMAETIFGDSVEVRSANYTGDTDSSGIYTQGEAIAPGVVPSDTGVMFSTGDLRSFTNNNATQSNLSTGTTSNSSGPNNVPEFNAAAGGVSTFDASYLDVTFVPTGSTMTMQLVFASEEYPEYTNSAFQDFVGIWVNGSFVNLAVGNGDVNPGNLNSNANSNLFQDNTNDQLNTEMDGVTITLALNMVVNPNIENTIRIGIADVADNAYDSTLIIAADSVQTALVANDDDLNMGSNNPKTFNIIGNDQNTTGGVLTITHINGELVGSDGFVDLPSGQRVFVNSDGTITIVPDGDQEVVNFTYQVESSTGETDTAFITLDTVPCFVAETPIMTDRGERPVEELVPGDLVLTKDNGLQPLRWIGTRRVKAQGKFAPIIIRAGAFGDHSDLAVSPLHRILIRDSLAELLFGEAEVLVAARDLVNDHSVRQVEGGFVDYFHILFDQHQVVYSAGLETESFLPGPQIDECFEAEMVTEIQELFPEVFSTSGDSYTPSARPSLKRYEALLLSKSWAA